MRTYIYCISLGYMRKLRHTNPIGIRFSNKTSSICYSIRSIRKSRLIEINRIIRSDHANPVAFYQRFASVIESCKSYLLDTWRHLLTHTREHVSIVFNPIH